MKTKLLSILVALPILLLTSTLCAQTLLAPGDIAVFQLQADTPDDFAFVTFVDIDAGTVIYFSDLGMTGTSFGTSTSTSEGTVRYTAPASGLTAGAIVRRSTNSDFTAYSDPNSPNHSAGSALNLATSGDQIIVFQANGNASGSANASLNPTFIFAINAASTQFTGSHATSSTQTGLPNGLVDTGMPRTALAVGSGSGPSDEHDNVIYMGSYDFTGAGANVAARLLAAKIAFTNPANYYGTSTNLPGDGTYNGHVSAIPAALMLVTLSNQEFALDNAFTVTPNPSNGNITIGNSGIAIDNVKVSDLNGRTVASYNLNGTTDSKELNLGSVLSSGMYLMTISSQDASTVKKIVIK